MSVDDRIVPEPPGAWHEDDWDDPDLVPEFDVERPVRSRPW